MEIFELLNFSLADFVGSTEGILLILGCLCMIIGIIIIIRERAKSKKDNIEPVQELAKTETSTVQEVNMPTSTPVEDNQMPVVPNVVNEVPNMATSPVVNTPVESLNFNQPASIAATPSMEQIQPQAPVVAPIAETLDMTTEINPQSLPFQPPVPPVVQLVLQLVLVVEFPLQLALQVVGMVMIAD